MGVRRWGVVDVGDYGLPDTLDLQLTACILRDTVWLVPAVRGPVCEVCAACED